MLAELRRATAARAKMITVGILVAAFENSLRKDTWRNPSREQKRCFRTLADWGHDLHWVERLVNDPTADAEQDPDRATGSASGPITAVATRTSTPWPTGSTTH